MFEVELEKHGVVRVSFKHWNPSRHKCVIPHPGTFCRIVNGAGKVVVARRTNLHKNDWDKYNKEFGRKLSLTRAVATFPRSERTKIWKAYFEAKKS